MSKDTGRVTTQQFYEMQIKTNESISGLKNSVDTHIATTDLRLEKLEGDSEDYEKDIKALQVRKKLQTWWDGANSTVMLLYFLFNKSLPF